MKFNQIYRLLMLTSVLCFKIIRGDNSEANKWHIIGELLYYIEVEQKYGTDEAFQHCKSLGMINRRQSVHPVEFAKHVESFYGYVPLLWAVGYAHCQSNIQMNNQMEFVNERCSEKFGFICSADILYGEIQFKNGTQLFISRDEVIEYCDPQVAHALDQ